MVSSHAGFLFPAPEIVTPRTTLTRRMRRVRNHAALGAASLGAAWALFAAIQSNDPVFRASLATAYVALWGTYFGRKHGRTVVRLTFDTAGRVVRQSVFARGFDHPLAVLVATDGGLLVSDWGTGRIYRIAR